MNCLKKEDILEKTLEAIPEIRQLYEKELEWNTNISPHIFFGDIINPYIIDLLGSKNLDNERLNSIFCYFEQMAVSDDLYIQQILTTTVLERLGDDKAIFRTAKKYMGLQTRKLSNKIEKAINRL